MSGRWKAPHSRQGGRHSFAGLHPGVISSMLPFMDISSPVKRAGNMTAAALVGTVTVWSAVNDGKTLYIPASGDFREPVIFSRAPTGPANGLTPEMVFEGMVMGTSGPVAMVSHLLYPKST